MQLPDGDGGCRMRVPLSSLTRRPTRRRIDLGMLSGQAGGLPIAKCCNRLTSKAMPQPCTMPAPSWRSNSPGPWGSEPSVCESSRASASACTHKAMLTRDCRDPTSAAQLRSRYRLAGLVERHQRVKRNCGARGRIFYRALARHADSCVRAVAKPGIVNAPGPHHPTACRPLPHDSRQHCTQAAACEFRSNMHGLVGSAA